MNNWVLLGEVMSWRHLFCMLAVGLACTGAAADQREELLTLRNAMLGMIESLVDQGVITEAEAIQMIETAEEEAASEAAALGAPPEPAADSVRVTYVPQIVKDEIRENVMQGLRREVADDVINEAREEAWGVPGALPQWISDIRWSSDLRVRAQADVFDSGNAQDFYRNTLAINDAGGIELAGRDALLNVSEDVHELRVRLRLGFDMQLSGNWHAGARLATSNESVPVTRNSVLEQSTPNYNAVVDLAYLHYRSPYFLFSGGRIPNPFVRSSLVWDADLVFEGVALTGVLPIDLLGAQNRLFLTGGAFPLESIEFAERDKWLFGGQVGWRMDLPGGAHFTLAGSYYDYYNVAGRANEPESRLLDYTAPAFLQKGNSLFDIRTDDDSQTNLFALLSDYDLAGGTFVFDSGPIFRTGSGRGVHLALLGDYVQNIGWDDDDILERTGVAIDERTEGYQLELELGTQGIGQRGDFQLGALYRHLQRDAVLDAFTDSEFHGGGTDAEGWGIDIRYGLSSSVWMELSYLTASEIDGPPLGIDTLMLDLSARF